MSLPQRSQGRPYAKFMSQLFTLLCASCMILCVFTLLLLLWSVTSLGWEYLDWDLLSSFPSRFPEKAGIKSALAGSIYLIGLTSLFSIPIGVGSAIYLEEYAPPSRWRTFVQLNIANLAGVPSIVYGILGLALFSRYLGLDKSLLAGALTLTLVVLPIVILSAQEALRAVPGSIRQASYALGATRWQTIWHQLLPASLPGILTGVILSVSRALGEAAPLVAIGIPVYYSWVPEDLTEGTFSALPLLIFYWSGLSEPKGFYPVAAAAIVVLVSVLICMNALAVILRYRFSKKIKW